MTIPAFSFLAIVPPRSRILLSSTPGYTQIGDVPTGINCGAEELGKIGALVDERAACRAAKDFEKADDIKEQLRWIGGDDWGVKVRDLEREWYVTTRRKRGSTVVENTAPADQRDEPASLDEWAERLDSVEPTDAAVDEAVRLAVDEATVAESEHESLAAPPPQGFDWGATY